METVGVSEGRERPLVVDVDGTLVKTDLLVESFFALLSRRPLRALQTLGALFKGRAQFKAAIAQESDLDFHSMPLNSELVALVRAEKARGRPVYLASAADRRLVDGMADSLELFDGVFASDGRINLSGKAKAEALVNAFGSDGFDYAGDTSKDISVWDQAHRVLVVGATPAFLRTVRARFADVRSIDERSTSIKDYVRALRVHQWVKNILICVPVLAAHRFGLDIVLPLIMTFLSYSLAASSAYLANDLLDLANDRAHPTKRNRPFASGRIPLLQGILLVPLLLLAAFALSLALPREFLLLLAGYYLLTTTYSVWLKRKLIIDVVILACLYGLRILAGNVVFAVPLSPWLIGFSTFLFLSLALIKRCTELIGRREAGSGDPQGRGYIMQDLPMLEAMAAASANVAVMVFALYINSEAVTELYRSPVYLWGICLVLFYWISRILILTHRGMMHDDPVVFAATDPKSLVCGGLILAIVAVSI